MDYNTWVRPSTALRFVLYGLALAGVLATAHPADAGPLAPPASDCAQGAAPATEQPGPLVGAWSSSFDAPPPASAGRDNDIIPIGLGWG